MTIVYVPLYTADTGAIAPEIAPRLELPEKPKVFYSSRPLRLYWATSAGEVVQQFCIR